MSPGSVTLINTKPRPLPLQGLTLNQAQATLTARADTNECKPCPGHFDRKGRRK